MKASWAALLLVVGLVLSPSLAGCGGGKATGSESSGGPEQQRLRRYRTYLTENAAWTIAWTEKMRGQIAVGDAPRAQSRYATARVQFGQIELIARTLPSLYARIDGPGRGYHRIERPLFAAESVAGLKAPAKRLVADLERLRKRLATVELKPARLARDAAAMMRVVTTARLAGKEEPYSHLDLVDISANVEGAEEAFKAAAGAGIEDERLSARIERGFEDSYAALKVWGLSAREPQYRPAAAGARFSSFTELTPTEIRELAEPLERLAALLGQVSGRIEAE